MSNLETGGGSIETKTSGPQMGFGAFQAKAHIWGRLTLWSVIILTLIAPMYLSFVLGFHPGWGAIFSGFLAYASIIAFVWFIEPISYYPILGVSGTYLAFLNGNIGNLCLPCASMAQTVVGAEPGTKKAEVTATLAIAASAIVNMVMLIFAILVGSYLVSLMPESVVDAFRFVLPAIFGAVIAQFAIQKPSWGLVGITFGLAVNLGPIPQALETFLVILGTVVVCMLLEKIKGQKEEQA